MSGIGAWYRQFKTSTSTNILTKYRHRYWYRYRCIPSLYTKISPLVDSSFYMSTSNRFVVYMQHECCQGKKNIVGLNCSSRPLLLACCSHFYSSRSEERRVG